jgi:hypothetical protein
MAAAFRKMFFTPVSLVTVNACSHNCLLHRSLQSDSLQAYLQAASARSTDG